MLSINLDLVWLKKMERHLSNNSGAPHEQENRSLRALRMNGYFQRSYPFHNLECPFDSMLLQESHEHKARIRFGKFPSKDFEKLCSQRNENKHTDLKYSF
jgi:hypothetical protein